jgi:glutathione S-transferase
LRAKALESVSDVTLAVFSSAFGHFRFNLRTVRRSRPKCGETATAAHWARCQRAARPVAGCGHGRVGQRQRADRPGRSRLGEAWRERALSELPKKIDALHAEIASLHQSLADPDFYRQDARAFAVKTARLGVARSELEAAETEWLELEILREEFKS